MKCIPEVYMNCTKYMIFYLKKIWGRFSVSNYRLIASSNLVRLFLRKPQGLNFI